MACRFSHDYRLWEDAFNECGRVVSLGNRNNRIIRYRHARQGTDRGCVRCNQQPSTGMWGRGGSCSCVPHVAIPRVTTRDRETEPLLLIRIHQRALIEMKSRRRPSTLVKPRLLTWSEICKSLQLLLLCDHLINIDGASLVSAMAAVSELSLSCAVDGNLFALTRLQRQ